MKRYKILSTIHVDGKKFDAGTIVAEGEIPSGNIESGLRVGWLAAADEPPAEDAPVKKAAAKK